MSDSENLYAGSNGLLPEVEVQLEKARRDKLSAAVSDYGSVNVGPRSGDIVFKVTGFDIAESPTVVLCQARQMDNLDHGWSDQFVIQVIETGKTFVRIRVRRIDSNAKGWGQRLRVDILVIN